MKNQKKDLHSVRYRESLGELSNEPLIAGLLEELERIENIRDDLYKEYKNGNISGEYTNKAGATNTVVNPAVKEYKAYCQQFANICKTIISIVKEYQSLLPPIESEFDDLERLMGIGKK